MKALIISSLLIFSSIAIGQKELSLQQVVDRVLTQNFGIQISKIDAEIAKNSNNPGNAGYLPTLNIEATQDLTLNTARQEFLSGDITEATNAKNTAFSAGAVLNWTFFDGFKMFITDKKLDELERYSELNLRAAMEMKIYEAVVNYYTLLSLQEMEEVYTGAIELSKMRKDYTQNRFNSGAANRIQLMQAELDLTADSAAYIANQQAQAQIKADLIKILQLPVNEEIRVKGDLNVNEETPNWDEIAKQFSEQNTSIMQAKSNIAVTELTTKEAKSRFYPQLSFYAAYNFGSSVNEVGFLASNRSYGPSVGITASWSILNHLSRATELRNSRLNEERAQLTLKNDSISALADLNNYYQVLQFSKEKLLFEQRNISQTQSIIEISQKALNAGSITPLELREIQYSAIQAEGRLLQSQIEYQTARLNIALLSGDFQRLF
ncbi:TolC family protein [Brumimicrobium aurantiacum]|uniref:TolC family protein n=1 Tax=Brumimicrobium aurantiacum TaxID=1737063 RepID=A0A3E1EUQ5_9FLAO|nr:TolC family protein [Brumimicrobium aurantiacum]RFC53287.1 TolC family protein [Brumimicrobium aurantiacum]